uniref:LDLRAD1-like C-terminal domain-containing protein n=1 Tax=Callorhinchus milii TaxID=7868 RepID=A0A4W3HU04_CALMI
MYCHIKIIEFLGIPEQIWNLGVLFDPQLSFKLHICVVTRSAFPHLRNIACLRHCLSPQAAKNFIHAFNTSCLDCANCLLTVLPNSSLCKLQLLSMQINGHLFCLCLAAVTRQCKTTSDRNGFLCDDRTTCLMSTQICNGKVDCSNGEDEANLYCDNLPMSLPKNLVFLCSDQKSWTYIDKKCNGKNDCGDCSDESGNICPPCFGWKCTTVFFSDCDCIPKSRCKDHIQDCSDWSDENICI